MNNRTFLIVSLLLNAAVVVAAIAFYPSFPETVPIHWDIHGKADGFAPKSQSIGWIVAPPLLLAILLHLLPNVSPKSFSIETFRHTYNKISAYVLVLMVYISGIILVATQQVQFNSGKWIIAGVMLLIGLMGNEMGKVKRNMFMGIRTPWTLASDANWNATHRLGARLMFAGGLMGGILVAAGVYIPVVFVLFLVIVLYPIAFSYWYFRKFESAGQGFGDGSGNIGSIK